MLRHFLSALCAFQLFAGVGSTAQAIELSTAQKSAVDSQLFKGTIGLPEVVFKHDGPIRLGVSDWHPASPQQDETTLPVLRSVFSAYATVVGRANIEVAKTLQDANTAVYFVDERCDAACRNKAFNQFKGGTSLLFELKSDDGTLTCGSRAPLDMRTGRIRIGLSVVDISVPREALTFCLLIAMNNMLGRSNSLEVLSFPKRVGIEGMSTDDIVRRYMQMPGKAGSLNLLYHPAVRPGMTREQFWEVVGSLPEASR